MAKTIVSDDDFKKLVAQANLQLSTQEETTIKAQIDEALSAVQVLQELDTDGIPTLNHPTGTLANVFREDVVEPSLSQELALSGAKKSYNGYFVVKAVFDETT